MVQHVQFEFGQDRDVAAIRTCTCVYRFLYKEALMKERFMREALKQARKAYEEDEVPIGAVIVKDGKIIARGHNKKEKTGVSIWHAEMDVIRKASQKLGDWRLEDCDLYVTLEPCPMCAGACIQSRIRKIYYGASDPKGGSIGTLIDLYDVKGYNHYPQKEGGVLEEECAGILKEYFKSKRKRKESSIIEK